MICRHCRRETNETLPHCQHCGEPLRPSGLISFLKPRASDTTAPGASEPVLPASAVAYFLAEEFFVVRASGERSLIARLFGTMLDWSSLCSALLFSAYAALVMEGHARLDVAAVTPTGALVFPIRAQWIKLIFEPLRLHREQQSLEGMLMARANARLTTFATQQLIADLIGWQYAMNADSSQASWNRHYADALTTVVRRTRTRPTSADLVRVETLLKDFYQQHKSVATYLSHEVSLIVQWIAAQQDAQLLQRQQLLAPNEDNPLIFSPLALEDEEYWHRVAQYV